MQLPVVIGSEGQTVSETLAVALVGRTVEAVHEEVEGLSIGLDDGNFVRLIPKEIGLRLHPDHPIQEGFEVSVAYLPRLREARIKEMALALAQSLRRGEDPSSDAATPYQREAWLSAGCVYEDGARPNAERLERWARGE